MKVVVYSREKIPFWRFPTWLEGELKENFPEVEFEIYYGEPPLEQVIGEAEVLISGRLKREEFRRARKLKWIHTPFVGVGNMLFKEMIESPVVITNSKGVNAPSVASHAISLSLALIRGLPWAFHKKSERDYNHRFFTEEFLPMEPEEVKAGVFGFGEVGRRIFHGLKALGFEVLCLNSSGTNGCFSFSELDDFLRKVNLLIISAPRTSQTEACIDLERMKLLGGFLVNVGRGKIVREWDLVKALKEGFLRGAALDVFEKEPLDEKSPLWTLPNLIITPHIAGNSSLFWKRQRDLLVENLRRFINGEPLLNVVDKKKGY